MTIKILLPMLIGGLLCGPVELLAQAGSGASTSSGTSRAFNPAISLNGLFLISAYPGLPDHPEEEEGEEHAHADEAEAGGINLQEVELRFSADIDPYSRADATFAFHGAEFHIEEVAIRSSILGGGFGVRGGKFYVDATSENTLHTHQYPFIRRSLIDEALFIEPYTDVGLELSYLFPFTSYIELKGVVVDGKEPGLFQTGLGDTELSGGDLAYNGTLFTLFDLSESSTLGFMGRWLGGRNDLGSDALSQVASASAIYRWRPTRTNRYKSLRLHAEYVYGDRQSELPGGGLYNGGWYGYVQYQFARRWWAEARYGTLQRSFNEELNTLVDQETRRSTVQLSFVPSEFQALRFEYSYVESPQDAWSEIFLQFNFTIGSHPAHRY